MGAKKLEDVTYYTFKDVVEKTKLSRKTLERYIRQGKLKKKKLSNQTRFTEKAVIDFIETISDNGSID